MENNFYSLTGNIFKKNKLTPQLRGENKKLTPSQFCFVRTANLWVLLGVFLFLVFFFVHSPFSFDRMMEAKSM